jgi:hypothetical protein
MIKSNRIKQYLALRAELVNERLALVARLREIENVLAANSTPVRASRLVRRGRRRRRRARNAMSLYKAIARVTRRKPLTKPEILKAIHRLGYRFQSKTPINSLNAVLYAKRQFKNLKGKFSPATK